MSPKLSERLLAEIARRPIDERSRFLIRLAHEMTVAFRAYCGEDTIGPLQKFSGLFALNDLQNLILTSAQAEGALVQPAINSVATLFDQHAAKDAVLARYLTEALERFGAQSQP